MESEGVTAVPQGAGAAVGGVEVVHVASPEGDDEPGDGLHTLRCGQPMHKGVVRPTWPDLYRMGIFSAAKRLT